MTQSYRDMVLIRDNYTCQTCGGKQDLRVHHIVPVCTKGDDSLPNLITLCGLCHKKAHDTMGRTHGKNIKLEKVPAGYRIKTKISRSGSVMIPARIREILKLEIGDDIIFDLPEKQA